MKCIIFLSVFLKLPFRSSMSLLLSSYLTKQVTWLSLTSKATININSHSGALQVKWPNLMPTSQGYINNYSALQNMCLNPIFPFIKNYLLAQPKGRNHRSTINSVSDSSLGPLDDICIKLVLCFFRL